MKTRLKAASSVLALASVVALTACEEQPSTPRPPQPTVPTTGGASGFDDLYEKLDTPERNGGQLVARVEDRPVTSIDVVTETGDRVRKELRILNVGDMNVTLGNLVLPPRISDTDCETDLVLEPNQSCFVRLELKPERPTDIFAEISVFSDASLSPRLSVPVSITVEPPPPPPETVDEAPAPPPAPPKVEPRKPRDPVADHIRSENSRRSGGGIGRTVLQERNGFTAQPEIKRVTRDQRYDPEMFPWVETSLPVDRSRILTTDRVVKAALETPIFTAIDGHVVAVTINHTYAPTGTEVLLPAGTKFMGRVRGVVDERADIRWNRFITPNGVSVKLEAESADAMSRPGVPGHLDRRMWDRYGLPLMMSTLTFVSNGFFGEDETTRTSEDGTDITDRRDRSSWNIAGEEFREDVRGITENVINDLKDTRQVLNIPKGTRIDIVPTQDIYFKSAREVVALNGETYELPEQGQPPEIELAEPKPLMARPTEMKAGQVVEGQPVIEVNGRRYLLTPAPSTDEQGRPIEQPEHQSSNQDPGQRSQQQARYDFPPPNDPYAQ